LSSSHGEYILTFCGAVDVLRVTSPRATDLFSGKDVYQQGCRRLTHPLSRELVRYTVVGGLASLVDVGLLVGLTTFGGVYYLHAATIALGCGLLTSYLLSIAWVFQARTWHNPVVEFGLFTLISGGRADKQRRVYVGLDGIRAPALSRLQAGGCAVCLSLEFPGQEMCVISLITKTAACVGRAVTLARGTISHACSARVHSRSQQ
jgi:putative flippase GtrA